MGMHGYLRGCFEAVFGRLMQTSQSLVVGSKFSYLSQLYSFSSDSHPEKRECLSDYITNTS
jgi:hypothetical protein